MLYATVYDTFNRTTSNGWGTSDSGHAWTVSVSGDSSTTPAATSAPGYAVHAVSAVTTPRYSTVGPNAADVDIRFQVGVSAFALTQPVSAGAVARWADSSNHYYFRVDFNTDQVIGYQIHKVVAGADTLIASGLVTLVAQVASGRYWVRCKVSGTSLKVKIWSDATGEPTVWTGTTTDAAISAAGKVGLRSVLVTGNTNTQPVTFKYSYFTCSPYINRDGQKLQVAIEAAFGADISTDAATWNWYDITAKVAHENILKFRQGRSDGSSAAEPATIALELFNTTGDFSEDNPTSIYYPNVIENVPFRVRAGISLVQGIGYANGWVPSWDTSGKRAITKVTASGITRRLKQGKTPFRAPIYRAAITKGAIAFWPCDDGKTATVAANAISGGPSMVMPNAYFVHFGGFDSKLVPAGSGQLPDMTGGGALRADLPPYAITNTWTIECCWAGGDGGTFANSYGLIDWMTVDSAGNRVRYGFYVYPDDFPTPSLFLDAADASTFYTGTTLTRLYTSAALTDGTVRHVRFVATQSGSSKDYRVYVNDVLVASDLGNTAGHDLGRIESVVASPYVYQLLPGGSPGRTYLQTANTVGNIAVYNTAILPVGVGNGDHYNALKGYPGELASARIARLCREQGVPAAVLGTSTTAMGVQKQAVFVDLLKECETADLGVLWDGLGAGVTYVPRTLRYDQDAAMTLNRAAGHIAPPFEPDQNPDQKTRNDLTVGRVDGSSARFVDSDATHPKSTARAGTYDEQLSLNVSTDAVLLDQAAYRVHQGTVSGYRWPAINVNLANATAGPALLGAWTDTGVTSRVDVTNPPSQAGPNSITSVVEGYSMSIGFFEWEIGLVASPYEPWRVGVVEGSTEPLRLETGGSKLDATVNSSATSLTVSTQVFPAWVTTAANAADFPYDVEIEGERLTVTGIVSGAVDAFGRTTANGWGTADTGGAWTTSGGAASDYSTGSGVGKHSIGATASARGTLIGSGMVDCDAFVSASTVALATGSYVAPGIFARWLDASNFYRAEMRFNTDQTVTVAVLKTVAGVETSLGTFVPPITHAAATLVRLRFQTIGTALRARAWSLTGQEPVDWHVTVIDSALTAAGAMGCRSILNTGNSNTSPVVVSFDDFLINSPQTITVTRSVNGVSKSHSAGAAVKLWHAPALAL